MAPRKTKSAEPKEVKEVTFDECIERISSIEKTWNASMKALDKALKSLAKTVDM